MPEQDFKYGGFWPRLAALLLDTIIIVLSMGAFVLSLEGLSRYFWIFYVPAGALFSFFYGIYLVRRFGGTPGKLIMGLRILRVTGEPVRYREAVIRYSPDFVFGLLASLGFAVAALSMTDDEYFSRSWFALQKQLDVFAPRWTRWVDIANDVWTWSEVIVLLTNRKRRALHDFLAGTVVIVAGSREQPTGARANPPVVG